MASYADYIYQFSRSKLTPMQFARENDLDTRKFIEYVGNLNIVRLQWLEGFDKYIQELPFYFRFRTSNYLDFADTMGYDKTSYELFNKVVDLKWIYNRNKEFVRES